MIRKILPYSIKKILFGDRKQFGTKCDYKDPEYLDWSKNYLKFYEDNQKGSIGKKVNHFGFKIVKSLCYKGKVLVELGPGLIEHIDYNAEYPDQYILVDIDRQFLTASSELLGKKGYNSIQEVLIQPGSIELPFEDNSIDIILTFHQLEHVCELEEYLVELKRVLKPDGILAGAVPTEGGVAWGVGRFLTSRRYVKKNMDFNYDKIICWEHPNFVDKIRKLMLKHFTPIKLRKRPFAFLPFDFNLSFSFILRK